MLYVINKQVSNDPFFQKRDPVHLRIHHLHVFSGVDPPSVSSSVQGPLRNEGSGALLSRMESRWLHRNHEQQKLLFQHQGKTCFCLTIFYSKFIEPSLIEKFDNEIKMLSCLSSISTLVWKFSGMKLNM
jgi:hypothetical protein